jgi:hypothetical protein
MAFSFLVLSFFISFQSKKLPTILPLVVRI